MAFNFNWTPLTADQSFYERAQELLTVALNKYPKPPIIVDDILVTELNLGSVPPDLEILEVGDIAEDRFRGIFKMCYSGDAYMTLKTRVQVRLKIKAMKLANMLIGQPSKHISFGSTIICITRALSCSGWSHNSSQNHPLKYQAISVHNTRVFKTERVDTSLP